MSLYQDLNEGVKYLADKYNEPDMDKIINDYCDEIIRTVKQDDIAKHYVLNVDRERYENKDGSLTDIIQFNTGHIYSGLMYDNDLNIKFIQWYQENYLTYEDIHDHYLNIDDCINNNFIPGLGTVVISELITNGLNNYDIESVRNTFAKIDEDERKRNRGLQKDNDGKTYFDATPTKEFLKSIVRCCYKIARDFDPIQIAQYISRDLSISYDKPVERFFYIDDGKKTMKISGQNNNDLLDAMYDMLDYTLSIHDDDYGYDEEFYNQLKSKDCDVDIYETDRVYIDDLDPLEIQDYEANHGKSL